MNTFINVDTKIISELGEVIEKYNEKRMQSDSHKEIENSKEELKKSKERQKCFLDEVNNLIINTIEPTLRAMRDLLQIRIQTSILFVEPIIKRNGNNAIKFDITIPPTLSRGEICFVADKYRRVIEIRTTIYKCAGKKDDFVDKDNIIDIVKAQGFFEIKEIDSVFIQRKTRDLIEELIRRLE